MKSTILHHRPPGQNVPAKPPANLPERPRGVDPARVPLAPGAPARAVAVLADLSATLPDRIHRLAKTGPSVSPRRTDVFALFHAASRFRTAVRRQNAVFDDMRNALEQLAELVPLLTPDMAASILAEVAA